MKSSGALWPHKRQLMFSLSLLSLSFSSPSSLPLPSHCPPLIPQDTVRRQPSARRIESSPGTGLTCALILDFPVSRTVRNKLLLFNHRVCGVLWQPGQTKTITKPFSSVNLLKMPGPQSWDVSSSLLQQRPLRNGAEKLPLTQHQLGINLVHRSPC